MYPFYYVLIFIFLVPSTAHAYLDPGTGNILAYVLISLAGAFVFSLKSIFYALIGKKGIAHGKKDRDSIVIFSEGKNYWNTFKPIVHALIARGQDFSYYTMDIDDPCLTIRNDKLNTRYIGNGNMAYAKMGNLTADVVLSTTPNIGTEGFPLPRSSKIKCLVHVFHALIVGVEMYMKGSLDKYDAVMIVGDHTIPNIRELEELRNLPPKELYPAGLPYFDELLSNKPMSPVKGDRPVILIAPSWGGKGCLSTFGTDFIGSLAKEKYKIIVRPHPQSFKVEKEIIKSLELLIEKHNNITIDSDPDGTTSMREADLLISDKSGIRFDYAFLYEKPVITLDIPIKFPEIYELSDLKTVWADSVEKKIGVVVSQSDIDKLPYHVASALKNATSTSLANFRDECIYNIGKSGEVIADYLINKLKKLSEKNEII